MGRLFGLIAMLVSLYIAMTLYTQGIEAAFGGAFAPIESSGDRDAPIATNLTPAAQTADAPSERKRRVRVTDAVREQVNHDIEMGTRRRGY